MASSENASGAKGEQRDPAAPINVDDLMEMESVRKIVQIVESRLFQKV